jgi:glycine/D-amino acid oxidase-like deaminating enzyme
VDVSSGEVAVVGAGIVGLSVADALARDGVEVRCFEAAEPGRGQSAGQMRVFRHVHDRPDLVELAARARVDWDRWSERARTALIGDEGVLFASPEAESFARLLAGAGIEHRLVEENEQRLLLPVLSPPGGAALYDVRGGPIHAATAVAALVTWLGDRLVHEEVLTLDRSGRIETAAGAARFERVLVCAGAGTPALAAQLGLACWLDRTNAFEATVYSGPIRSRLGFAVGLATEDADPAGSVERVRRYVERALPGLDPEPIETITRPLTILPWHPDAFAAWEAGAALVFAGHNLFKFAPPLGRLLADVCRGGAMPPLLTPPG